MSNTELLGMAPFSTAPYQSHNHARLEHLASLGLPLAGCRVLELGSGPGDHTGFYVERNCSIVSVDSRQECLAALKERYPGVQTVLCDLNAPAPLMELGGFDVIHCYGLLYHLEQPGNLLQFVGEACNGFAILETCVAPDRGRSVNLVEEESANFTQSSTGRGCRPARRWIFEELGRYFPFVYHTRTQPSHPEFPINWNDIPKITQVIRSVFVASKRSFELPSLSSELLDVQERFDERAYIAQLELIMAAQCVVLDEREKLIFRIHNEAADLRNQLERAVEALNQPKRAIMKKL